MPLPGQGERAPPLEGAPFPAPFPLSCSDLMMTPLFVVIASHSGTPKEQNIELLSPATEAPGWAQ